MTDEQNDQLAQAAQALAALSPEQLQQLLAQLKQPPAESSARSGGVDVKADKVELKGDVVGRDKIVGNVYYGAPPKDQAEALRIYRSVVASACGQLPLRGVDVGAADPTTGQKPLGLANVYVDLDTTARVKMTEEEKQQREREVTARGEDETRPLGALEELIHHRQMVLLGDPGGGKSTFVNHIALCLALNALEPQGKWIDQLAEWPQSETDLLPIVIILRDFARGLPSTLPRADLKVLWDFIVERLTAQNLAFAKEPLEQALENGRALILLDGLDEVPTVAQRIFVRDAVTTFMRRYSKNRFLITCRVLSYQAPAKRDAPDLRVANVPVHELAPFDEAKIDRFVTAWYTELSQAGVVRNQDVDGLTRQLREAVRRPDLWRLASNPLLLTVMALVHTHKGRLPDARALLYEETVDILLWRWEQVRMGGQDERPPLRQLLLAANRAEVDLKRVLGRLAYEAHAQGKDGDEQDKLADIGELKLEKALAALKDDDLNWARQMINEMKFRAGLLLERAPEVFTFPHRTFQGTPVIGH